MPNPTFSIIIPTLNEEKFLPALLGSLGRQTDSDYEVIVVDGKSKDKTIRVAKQHAASVTRLTVVPCQKPSLPMQRNLGAQKARGEWLVFVDADSVLMPYFLERIRAFIREKNPSVFTTWMLPDSEVSGDAVFTLFANIYLESTVLFKRPHAPGPLTAVRSSLFRHVGGYDESHEYNEDVEFGLRLAKHGAVVSLLREALYIWSMRRIRHEGKMKVMRKYILSEIPVLFLKRPLKRMPGYIMGGHVYKNTNSRNRPSVGAYEQKLRTIIRQMFA